MLAKTLTILLPSIYCSNTHTNTFKYIIALTNVITNNATVAFESSIFEGVDTFIRYIVNGFLGEQWMTNNIEQRRKYIRETRNKLVQLQICKRKDIYEYTYEFSKWYYDVVDNNMNMTILADTYYKKLLEKLNNYFQ